MGQVVSAVRDDEIGMRYCVIRIGEPRLRRHRDARGPLHRLNSCFAPSKADESAVEKIQLQRRSTSGVSLAGSVVTKTSFT